MEFSVVSWIVYVVVERKDGKQRSVAMGCKREGASASSSGDAWGGG